MPRFAANLSMMFNDVPFLERFGAARRAGFRGVEFLFPYDVPADAIKTELETHDLTMVLFNLPAGNWAAGDRGLACDPASVQACRDGVGTAIEYAQALGCRQLHIMAGLKPRDVSETVMRDTYVANVRYAAAELERHGLTLLIEAINTRDMPGFYLNTSQQAFALIQDVGAPNVRFQYDVYHMQIMEGDLAKTLETHLAEIGHIQIADPPARHEPGTGEINYAFLFDWIDRIGYPGWVGCEYRPKGKTEDGLGWMRRAAHAEPGTL
jgi:hydroxypyruvate isomerase